MQQHTQEEIWRPIPGWEGLYEASTHGRIRSLDRTVCDIRGRNLPVRGRILKGGLHSFGYPRVLLCRNNRVYSKNVHSLVLLTFVGPLPEGGHARHINGNPADNRLVNLAYGTVSENMQDKRNHGTSPQLNRTHCPRGHEYTPENTGLMSRSDRPNPSRYCKKCNADGCRRRYAAGLK